MPEWVGARLWHILAALLILAALNPSPAPEPLRDSLRKVELAQEGGRPEAALASLESALAFEPGDPTLQGRAAALAFAAGDLESVQQHLDAADAALGTSPERICLRAETLFRLGDPAGALAVWQSLPTACPDPPNHYRSLASAYLALDDRVGYEQALSTLAGLDPGDTSALRALSFTIAARDPDGAEASLRAADQSSPDGDPVARELIRAIGEARVEDDRAYSLAQVGQVFAQNSEWLYASWAFQEAVQLEQDYVEARAYLGLSLDRIGRDGLADLEAAVAEAPGAAQPHTFLGMHWRMKGENSKALAEFETAAELAPEDPAVAAELAATYESTGDYESALAAYRVAADLAPREPGFWLLLAQFSIRQELNIDTVGLPASRNAAALAPQDPAAWDSLGYCYLLAGDLEMSARILTRALDLAPNRPSTLYHLGLLRLYQGDLSGARAALQSAIDGDPGGPIADLAQRALDRVDS